MLWNFQSDYISEDYFQMDYDEYANPLVAGF